MFSSTISKSPTRTWCNFCYSFFWKLDSHMIDWWTAMGSSDHKPFVDEGSSTVPPDPIPRPVSSKQHHPWKFSQFWIFPAFLDECFYYFLFQTKPVKPRIKSADPERPHSPFRGFGKKPGLEESFRSLLSFDIGCPFLQQTFFLFLLQISFLNCVNNVLWTKILCYNYFLL